MAYELLSHKVENLISGGRGPNKSGGMENLEKNQRRRTLIRDPRGRCERI